MVRRSRGAGALALLAVVVVCGCDDEGRRLREHVLDRLGYGPDAASLARVEAIGVDSYIEEQLQPAQIPDPVLDRELASLPALSMSWAQLQRRYGGDSDEPLRQLDRASLARAVLSRRQLEAVLTDLWFNHFSVMATTSLGKLGMVPFERDVIRRHVLGRFEDMLLAVAKSPAMLVYLDNYVNRYKPPDSAGAYGPNENYARELLELHTVGPNGGWDQQDVVEVARCFTGWTVDRVGDTSDGFVFRSDWHDPDRKLVMGRLHLPPPGRMGDGVLLLKFLAQQPSTARRVAERLARRLVADDPPAALVARAADVYLETDGDLREVVRSIVTSPEFRDPRNFRSKWKSPRVFTVSWIRATGADFDEALHEALHDLRVMGEYPHRAPQPIGYPQASEAWLGADVVLDRFNVAARVAGNASRLGIGWGIAARGAGPLVDGLTERLLPGGLTPATRAVAVDALNDARHRSHADRVELAAALLLASPEFQLH